MLSGLALLVLGATLLFVYGDSVKLLRDELESWGMWSALAFIGLQAAWMLTTVPAVPLMLLAGVVYGVWLGTLYAVIGGVLGSSVVFAIGRKLGRDRLLSLSRHSRAVERGLELIERHPVASIAVVRAVPMFPLNLLNYAFGAMQLRFRTYLIVTTLLLAPAAAFYAGAGRAIVRAAFGENIPLFELVWLLAFALLTGILTWYGRTRARNSTRS